MTDTVLSLRLEHGKTAKLLDIIEVQLGKLKRADDIDCPLIGLVVDYLRSYEDECHHPKEDLIYRALRRRNLEAAKDIGDLVQHHDDLAKMTDALKRELEAAQESKARASRLKLKAPLTDFLIAYREHLAREEEDFFPVALRELTKDDWEEIDFDAFDREDPLDSAAVGERFERLREQILLQSE